MKKKILDTASQQIYHGKTILTVIMHQVTPIVDMIPPVKYYKDY